MEHTKVCVQGNQVTCPVSGQEYASTLVMHQHHHAKHGADAAVPQGGFVCPFCGKAYQVKKTGGSINRIVWTTLTGKVFIIVGLLDVHQSATPSPV